MQTWLRAIIWGVVTGGAGLLLGAIGLAGWFIWQRPPHFRNDSEAMSYQFLIYGMTVVGAAGGALVGAVLGSSLVWWRAGRSKIAGAIIAIGSAMVIWLFQWDWGAVSLFLAAVGLVFWDWRTQHAMPS